MTLVHPKTHMTLHYCHALIFVIKIIIFNDCREIVFSEEYFAFAVKF